MPANDLQPADPLHVIGTAPNEPDPILQLVMILEQINRETGYSIVPKPQVERREDSGYSERANPTS